MILMFFFHKHQKEILWEVLIYTFNQALVSAVLQSCWGSTVYLEGVRSLYTDAESL